MARNPTWVQADYQFYNDDGGFGAATTLAAQDTAADIFDDRTSTFRLRVNFGDTNNATQNNVRSVKLQLSLNGGAWADVTGSTNIRFNADVSGIADGANDPNQRLGAIVGTVWTSAWVEFDENNVTTSQTWTDDYTEYEFCLAPNAISAGQTYTFRVVTSSDEVPTITATPTLNIVAAPVPRSRQRYIVVA